MIRTPGADRIQAPHERARGGRRRLAAPARARRVRRPGRGQGPARRLARRRPRRAARRSTTCCSPARPAWARRRWRRSSPRSSTSPFVQTAGPALERKADIAAFLTALEPRAVFFVDEIHRLPRAVEETFYPAMEDRQLPITVGAGAGARVVTLDLPPFTLIGATTRAGLLTTPLRDRFGIQHRLDHYDAGRPRAHRRALGARARRARSTPPAPRAIAERARGTPRVANRLLKRVRDYAEVHGGGAIDADGRRRRARPARGRPRGPGPARPRDPLVDLHAVRRRPGRPVDARRRGAGGGRTRSRTSTSRTCSSAGFLQRTPRGRCATAHAFRHLGLEPPAATRLDVVLIRAFSTRRSTLSIRWRTCSSARIAVSGRPRPTASRASATSPRGCSKCGFGFLFELLDDYYPAPERGVLRVRPERAASSAAAAARAS